MIPMDWRAPFIQQRWVELYNAGANEVPAFGVCEVTGASRPEAINAAQNGGRTVLNVTRPTEDSPNAVCLNGPMPIPAGSYGFGTIHYPAYAKYATAETPVAGEEWGAASGTFELTKGKSGFVIFGDAANGIVRVDRLSQSPATGIPFRNDSGETVPAYGVMKVVDQVDIGGTQYLTINKPDYTFQRRYLINTGSAVADTETGLGNWLDESALVLYDESEGDPNGEEWGAWPGQWTLKKERLGFTLFKKSDDGIALGSQREIVSVFGKFYEELEQGGSADFKVWMRYDGQKRDTQMVLTAYDWYLNKDETIAKNTQGEVAWYSNKWHVRNAYCSEDDTDDAAGGMMASMGTDGSGFPQIFVSVSSSGGYISPSSFQGFDL